MYTEWIATFLEDGVWIASWVLAARRHATDVPAITHREAILRIALAEFAKRDIPPPVLP